MQNDSEQVNEKQTTLSSYITTKEKDVRQTPKLTSTTYKRDSSQLNQLMQTYPKKANIETDTVTDSLQSNGTATPLNSPAPITSHVLKDLVGPIIQEVRDLRESVHSDYNKLYHNYSKLEGSYSKLEDIITSQQQVINLKVP